MELVITKDSDKDYAFKVTNEDGLNMALCAGPKLEEGNVGFRPMQTFLASLGGCMSIDIMLVLKKQRQVVADYDVKIKGERVDAVPALFKKITLTVVVNGDVKENKLRQAIELSRDKYCSVYMMISKDVEVCFEYVLNGEHGYIGA